ncbi:MAG: MliC family protein [Pseudomonadota bacterium]
MRSTVLAVLSVLVWAVPAVGQEGPSFDCARASSSAEELVCEDAALAALDQRLAARFGAALAAAEGLDAGAGEAVATLRAMQRGWIKGRDDCWKAVDLRICVEDAYLTREGELVAGWMLEAPTAVVAYACADNPADEVVAHFFATERPSVRLEYGDSIETGVLVPAASGSRYAAGFGRGLWVRGDEALLTWPEGTEKRCVAVP